MLELGGMRGTLLVPLLPGSLWPWVEAPDWVLYMVQIQLKCVLKLNWILRNTIGFTLKLLTYAKLNCLKLSPDILLWKKLLLVNWIVWNRTVYVNKNGFSIKNCNGLYAIKPKSTSFVKNRSICKTRIY